MYVLLLLLRHQEPLQTIKFNAKQETGNTSIHRTRMFILSLLSFSCLLSASVLFLSLAARLAFCFLSCRYLFCDFPQAIPFVQPPPPPSVCPSCWPSTGFISARSSNCLPSCFFLGGGGWTNLFFFQSLSHMLGGASCLRVNEGAAWVNTRGGDECKYSTCTHTSKRINSTVSVMTSGPRLVRRLDNELES